MERARLRIGNAQLRSPIDGIVITPDLQNAAGEHLDAGATFAQVLDLTSARINIAVEQEDANLVRAGQKAAIKLDSFPAQTLRGEVLSMSPEAQPRGDSRVFYAHVLLPNRNAELRAGMEGRAKSLPATGRQGLSCCAARRFGYGRHYGIGSAGNHAKQAREILALSLAAACSDRSGIGTLLLHGWVAMPGRSSARSQTSP